MTNEENKIKELESNIQELQLALQIMASQRNNANDEIVKLNIIIAKQNNQVEQLNKPK